MTYINNIPEQERKRMQEAANVYADQLDEPFQDRAFEDNYDGRVDEYLASPERQRDIAIRFAQFLGAGQWEIYKEPNVWCSQKEDSSVLTSDELYERFSQTPQPKAS